MTPVNSFLITILLIVSSCGTPPQKTNFERIYFDVLGLMYGDFTEVKEVSTNSLNSDSTQYRFSFIKEKRQLTWKTEDEPHYKIWEYYYDANFQIDSCIEWSDDEPDTLTVYYYKTPFYEVYVHYSKLDTIHQEIDLEKRTVTFLIDNNATSVDSFDRDGFLVKETLLDSGFGGSSYTTYTYDDRGYKTGKYITIEGLGIRNFMTEKRTYEYDEKGNWTKRVLESYSIRKGLEFTRETKREIKYRE